MNDSLEGVPQYSSVSPQTLRRNEQMKTGLLTLSLILVCFVGSASAQQSTTRYVDPSGRLHTFRTSQVGTTSVTRWTEPNGRLRSVYCRPLSPSTSVTTTRAATHTPPMRQRLLMLILRQKAIQLVSPRWLIDLAFPSGKLWGLFAVTMYGFLVPEDKTWAGNTRKSSQSSLACKK